MAAESVKVGIGRSAETSNAAEIGKAVEIGRAVNSSAEN